MPRQEQSTLPEISTPNFSFNPGPAVSTGPAEIQIQKQQQEASQRQTSMENILHTTQMASQLVQSFVEASKQRQQRDAITAYASFDPTQSVNPQQDQKKLLAKVLATNPQDAAQSIIASQIPKAPTTLEQMMARNLQSTGNTSPQAIADAKQSLIKPAGTKVVQETQDDGIHNMLVDGKGEKHDLGLGKQPAPQVGKIFQSQEADGTTHNKRLEGDGTVTDLGNAKPSGAAAHLSAQAQSTAEYATSLLPHIDEMRQLIEKADAKGLVGPTRGRLFNDFLEGKVGSSGDPEIDRLLGKLKGFDTLIKSGTLKVHFGGRGGQLMYDNFKKVLDSGKQSAAAMNGGLDAIQSFMEGYSKMGQPAGKAAPMNIHGINIDTNALDAELTKRGLK